MDLTKEHILSFAVSVPMEFGAADISCFGIDEKEQLSDERYFIFYNQTSSPENTIIMQIASDKTIFQIDLNKLPSFIYKIVFTITNDQECAMRQIKQGNVLVYANHTEIANSSFSGADFQDEKAVILNELYKKDGIWRISSTLNGFNGGIEVLLSHFGGEETAKNTSQEEPAKNSNIGASLNTKKDILLDLRPAEEIAATDTAIKREIGTKTVQADDGSEHIKNAAPVVINLEKKGDSHKISLTKGSNGIHVNLNWNKKVSTGLFGMPKKIDLDLACMYILKDGHAGVIQALGNNFGNESAIPFIKLDHDDRSGNSLNGGNMVFKKPELVQFAVVFAFIYEGVSNWTAADASILLKQQGASDIAIHMDSSSAKERFCVMPV